MTEHGWERDEWPEIFDKVMAADILVLLSPIWLGEKSSVCTRVIERLYGNSHLLNDAGQWAYYGRVGGCIITGNEDGAKHCAMNILYSLQHLGFAIPPQADSGWLGEAGPGPSYLDPGSGGPENDFTNRNTTFLDLEPAAPGADAQGRGWHSRLREPGQPVGRGRQAGLRQSRVPRLEARRQSVGKGSHADAVRRGGNCEHRSSVRLGREFLGAEARPRARDVERSVRSEGAAGRLSYRHRNDPSELPVPVETAHLRTSPHRHPDTAIDVDGEAVGQPGLDSAERANSPMSPSSAS